MSAVVRNSAFNLAGQGVYAVFHLLSIVVLARALGTEGFGAYYTIFALVLVVQLLAEAGLGTTLTRRLVCDPDGRGRIVAEGASLFIAAALVSVGVLASIGLAFASWRADPNFVRAFLAAGIACAGMQVQRFGAGVLQASEQFGYENVARVAQGVVFASLSLVLIALDRATLTPVVAMLAVSHWTAAILLLGVLHRRRVLAWPSARPRWRHWIAEAGPLGFGDTIRGLTWQLDTVLLGILQPAAVVGIYSVAYRPLGPLNWVPRAILSASFPSFARVAQDRDALQTAFSRSARVLVVASIPIAVTVFVFAEPIVLAVAGPAFLEAAVPLRLLIWVTVLSFFTMHFRYVLAALDRQRTYAGLVLAVLALEAVIELALIPSWGYLGACAGTLAGELVFVLAGVVACRRSGIDAFRWLRPLARPV